MRGAAPCTMHTSTGQHRLMLGAGGAAVLYSTHGAVHVLHCSCAPASKAMNGVPMHAMPE